MATKSFDERVYVKDSKMASAMLEDLNSSSNSYVRGNTKSCSVRETENNAAKWLK